MRFIYALVFLLLTAMDVGAADVTHPAVNIFILRGGEQLSSPRTVAYRLVEWSQMRGKVILPDIGYYDSGYGNDQIWFLGGGADFIQRRHFSWEQEFYVTQEAGPESRNRRSIWVWSVFNFTLPRHSFAQVVTYPSIPLNRAQRVGFDVDRIKVEHRFAPQWLAGIGYAGGICASEDWHNSAFATVTRKTRAGDFEFWLQRVPEGGQVQVRYMLITGER